MLESVFYKFSIREMQPYHTSGLSMSILQYACTHSTVARCNRPASRACRCQLYAMFVHTQHSLDGTLPHIRPVDINFAACLYTFSIRELQPSHTSGLPISTLQSLRAVCATHMKSGSCNSTSWVVSPTPALDNCSTPSFLAVVCLQSAYLHHLGTLVLPKFSTP